RNIRVVSTPSSGPGPAASHLALSRQVYWPPSSHTGLVTHKQPSHAPPPPPLDGSYTSPSLENSTVPEKRPSPPSGSCGPSDPSPGQCRPLQPPSASAGGCRATTLRPKMTGNTRNISRARE